MTDHKRLTKERELELVAKVKKSGGARGRQLLQLLKEARQEIDALRLDLNTEALRYRETELNELRNERDALAKDLARVTAERGELIDHLRNCSREHMTIPQYQTLSMEHVRLKERVAKLREALRKCVSWAESISMRVTHDRESINWTYLRNAEQALADDDKENA